MTTQLSSLGCSCYMSTQTRCALCSTFIQNRSNEDKLLPARATMALWTLKTSKMAEWK